ncbi:MAG: nucleoside triphosphate pyrophosphohydrolase family protein [Candidatus Marsarchaeota archaeon]|jgi:NTP pyrophosphatase (non-canonical NTP hydrolase)|nr:nucleoside triphosphate pyrophosphohydrolase family protein [Candidatus Marsarchaeota archaeon]
MDLNEYQDNAKKTAVFPDALDGRFYYPAIGLAGEVGELLNKIKKIARDSAEINKEDLKSELGDVLWYLSQLAEELGISMEDVAAHNLEKLRDRAERGKIHGSGDNR